MKIIWFGHSEFRLDAANSVNVIDPFLGGPPVAVLRVGGGVDV